jgi:vacuole morphology and inheritance protein 14
VSQRGGPICSPNLVLRRIDHGVLRLVLSSDVPRISSIIDQLCGMFSSSNSALHTRNGGLIGLAATAIALGQDVAPFLGVIIPPVLACFQDPESRVRYHACESLYNM